MQYDLNLFVTFDFHRQIMQRAMPVDHNDAQFLMNVLYMILKKLPDNSAERIYHPAYPFRNTWLSFLGETYSGVINARKPLDQGKHQLFIH